VNARLLGPLAGVLLLTACTGAAPAPAAAPAPPEPPAPPAACLLDTAALRVATGLAWTADATTATDTRCVYDPEGGADAEFVVVDVAEPVTPLEEVADVCADGSRTPAGAGFVCRLAGGGLFAATVRDGELVTLAAAAVPAGTTVDRLAAGLAEQLTLLG
jgi:hypothetical protein